MLTEHIQFANNSLAYGAECQSVLYFIFRLFKSARFFSVITLKYLLILISGLIL